MEEGKEGKKAPRVSRKGKGVKRTAQTEAKKAKKKGPPKGQPRTKVYAPRKDKGKTHAQRKTPEQWAEIEAQEEKNYQEILAKLEAQERERRYLEALDRCKPVILPDVLEINNIPFEPRSDCKYAHDYRKCVEIAEGQPTFVDKANWYRTLVTEDLWFTVYFVLGVRSANHPFVVEFCKAVERGAKSNTLDLVFRGGFKSTAITIGETIQCILGNRETRCCILSYNRACALAFFRVIKHLFESSDWLKTLFPDVLWPNPQSDAPKWGEDTGLWCQRVSNAKEATLEAWGLTDGMPTGRHYTRIVYDDIMTEDLADSPQMIEKVKARFDMSLNLQELDTQVRIVGTPYHHEDVLMYIAEKNTVTGRSLYEVRRRPATVDGTANGASVFIPEEKMAELRVNKQTFYSQQLLDPTPVGERTFDPEWLIEVNHGDIPDRLFRFMAIDTAGTAVKSDGRKGDAWAVHLIGVRPFMDDLGLSEFFILDSVIQPMSHDEGIRTVVQMYLRGGMVLAVGIEKVGISTAEIHVANALRAKGKSISVEGGNLIICRPAGRKKEERIESALQWPMMNGKVKISKAVPAAYRERLKMEMSKFPFWADDGLDALAYGVELAKSYKFGKLPIARDETFDEKLRRRTKEQSTSNSWLYV